MKPKRLLRIASILMLLHAIGHALGATTWKKAPNAGVQAVVNAMMDNHFDFMGRSVSPSPCWPEPSVYLHILK